MSDTHLKLLAVQANHFLSNKTDSSTPEAELTS